jgi:hypothetical protein
MHVTGQATRARSRGSFALLAVLLVAGAAAGHGVIPRDVPVARVVTNLEAYIKEHPKEADAYYRLGRFHALAYEFKRNVVIAFENQSQLPEPAPRWQQKRTLDWSKDKSVPTKEELQTHLTEAIKNLNKSIEMDPHSAAPHLAMASILESGVEEAGDLDVHPNVFSPEITKQITGWNAEEVKRLNEDSIEGLLRMSWKDREGRSIREVVASLLFERHKDKADPERARVKALLVLDWKEQITEQYFEAMSLALPADSKTAAKPVWGSMEDWIAYEGAKSYLAAVKARGAREDEEVRVAVATAALKAFDSLAEPRGITPIIFSLKEPVSLTSLMKRDSRSGFDMDGTGRGQQWNWVGPRTGILVWDPDHTGRITSGRQLFGSVTWWMFFKDGYQALDTLDDNRDGRLSGSELNGLAVWFDRNGNGVCDAGEVLPIENLGIAAISTRATAVEDGCRANHAGLIMSDGRFLPTYDWIADALPERAGATRAYTQSGSIVALPLAGGVLAWRRRRCPVEVRA